MSHCTKKCPWYCKLIIILILFESFWRFRHGKGYFEASFCSGISCFDYFLFKLLSFSLQSWHAVMGSVATRLDCFGAWKEQNGAKRWIFCAGFFFLSRNAANMMFLLILRGRKLVSMSDIKCNFLIWKKKIKHANKECGEQGSERFCSCFDFDLMKWSQYEKKMVFKSFCNLIYFITYFFTTLGNRQMCSFMKNFMNSFTSSSTYWVVSDTG